MNVIKYLRTILPMWLISVLASSPAYPASLETLTYYTEAYPPFNFMNQGKITGISVDLLQEAAKFSGHDVLLSQIVLQPWARSYRSTILKKDGVLFSTTRTSRREELFHWVGPIDDIKVSVIARKGSNIKLGEPLEITSYKIGVIKDDVGEQMLLQYGVPRDSMQEATDVTMLAEQLVKKRIDLIAYDERSAHWWIKQAGYAPDQFETLYVLKQGLLYYAFNKNIDQTLLDDLQMGIDKVKNTVNEDGVNRYQAILNKYQ